MQCHRRWPYFALISLAALALSACSSTPPAFATPSARHDLPLHTVDSGVGKALRVILKFRQTVPYRDAAFLQDIGHHIHGRITYITSVSLDTHVYQIEPQPGQSHEDILRSLANIPSVLRVEADALAQPS